MLTCPEMSKRDTSQEGLWGQIKQSLLQESLPTGQGGTWDNKEEF
jgi:hypothetical protein